MMARVVEFEKRDEVAVVTLDNQPVNAINQAIRRALLDALSAARADDGVKALLVLGRGRQFSAGADIREFGNATRPPPHLREVVRAFDAADKPIVAVLHGIALGAPGAGNGLPLPGGGAGDATRAVGGQVWDHPGAGGTQLLPRLIGPARALEMITTGEPIGAREAAALGLVDRLIEGDLVAGALAFTREVASHRPLPRASRRTDRLSAPPDLFEVAMNRVTREARGAQAPLRAIAAVKAAVELPFDEGLERERELWAQAAASAEAAALRYIFQAERTAAKLPDHLADAPVRQVRDVGVIGTGTMGVGIAIAFANAGIDVLLVGRRQDRVDRALSTVGRHYARKVEKGKLTQADMQARLDRIAATTSWERMTTVDLAIETVSEDPDLKREIFAKLDATCGRETILATNTSSLDVDQISRATGRPAQVIGLHFFSPAHATKLVEIVRGTETVSAAVAMGINLAKQVGKFAVIVRAGGGVVSTRMFTRYQQEANQLLLEGALPYEIDAAMVGFGMAMGPLATTDLAGLDVAARMPIRDRLVEMGRLGQKTGLGYHHYLAGDRTPHRDPEVEAVIVRVSEEAGLTPPPDRRDRDCRALRIRHCR